MSRRKKVRYPDNATTQSELPRKKQNRKGKSSSEEIIWKRALYPISISLIIIMLIPLLMLYTPLFRHHLLMRAVIVVIIYYLAFQYMKYFHVIILLLGIIALIVICNLVETKTREAIINKDGITIPADVNSIDSRSYVYYSYRINGEDFESKAKAPGEKEDSIGNSVLVRISQSKPWEHEVVWED